MRRGLAEAPKSSGVGTIPSPNRCSHTRFTITRDGSGLPGDMSRRASSSRPDPRRIGVVSFESDAMKRRGDVGPALRWSPRMKTYSSSGVPSATARTRTGAGTRVVHGPRAGDDLVDTPGSLRDRRGGSRWWAQHPVEHGDVVARRGARGPSAQRLRDEPRDRRGRIAVLVLADGIDPGLARPAMREPDLVDGERRVRRVVDELDVGPVTAVPADVLAVARPARSAGRSTSNVMPSKSSALYSSRK